MVQKLIADKESPPNSKNESSILMVLTCKISFNMSMIVTSISLRGGKISLLRLVIEGRGNAFRLIFPLWL